MAVTLVMAAVVCQSGDWEAPARSAQPNLISAADGRLYLTWIRQDESGLAHLQFSVLEENRWTRPRTIAKGNDWFVNWADFPSLCALTDGTLAAHWLQKSGAGTYAYDVRLTISRDHGETWSPPVTPHRDRTQTEHGFVSLVALNDTTFGLFWLDGRAMSDKGGDMSLRFATLNRDGHVARETLVDNRVCECCQTSAVASGVDTAYVVYRDRSENETRDIRAALVRPGTVQTTHLVHPDGWVIHGCPVNGPVVRRSGNSLVVAWPTEVHDRMQVRVRFSDDGGETFGRMINVPAARPMGRVDAVMPTPQKVLVSWLEATTDGADIRWCRIADDGTTSEPQVVARTRPARAAGFPQMALHKGVLHFAWTSLGPEPRVRATQISLQSQAQ